MEQILVFVSYNELDAPIWSGSVHPGILRAERNTWMEYDWSLGTPGRTCGGQQRQTLLSALTVLGIYSKKRYQLWVLEVPDVPVFNPFVARLWRDSGDIDSGYL